MSNINLLPPGVEITPDVNLKIRIRVLAKVLYELTNVCGVNCEKDIKKGVLQKQIIQKFTISFIDHGGTIRGEVILEIDWDKLEFSAKTNEDITLLKKVDLNRLVTPQLDPQLYTVLKQHLISLKTKYNITEINTYFTYRKAYKANDKVYKETMNYLNHTNTYTPPDKSISSLGYELKTAFQGLDNCLNVIIRS